MAAPSTMTLIPSSARQLADRQALQLKKAREAEQFAEREAAYREKEMLENQALGIGGMGAGARQAIRGGGGGGFRMPRQPHERINAKATPAETGSEVIKRQGGLSPSYGPSGINDIYRQGPVQAWQRLQQSKEMAQAGRPADADRIERADQLQGMNQLKGAQALRNDVNFNTAALENHNAGAGPAFFPTVNAAQNAQQNAQGWEDPEQFDPYNDEQAMTSAVRDESVQAAAKGGHITGKAVVGEAGPETKFNMDGSIDRFNKPTLLNNAKPGIIVPNPALKAFLQRFNHPPKDSVGITPAFRLGGSLGVRDIGSGLAPQQEVIGLSNRGRNAMGGITTSAGTIAPDPINAPLFPRDNFTDDMYGENRLNFLPPYMIAAEQQRRRQAQQMPAYAEGGTYGSDEDEYRTDAQGNLWMRNPDKPNSGIMIQRARQPVNQTMRRTLQSWEDPQNGGIVQDVGAYEQGMADRGLGFTETGNDDYTANSLVQAPATRTPTTINSRYGTGSVSQSAQPTVIDNLPAEEFFQRAANRAGTNKFAQPEPDSSFASSQRPKGSKASPLAKTNPALFAQFEKWRQAIKQGQL